MSLLEGLSSGQSNLTLSELGTLKRAETRALTDVVTLVDFTEAVIQELLYIPPQLEVQSARVNSLRIMVQKRCVTALHAC